MGNLRGNFGGDLGDQPGLSPQFGVGSLERPHQQLVQRSRDQNSQRRSRRQSTNPNVFPDPYYGSNAAPFQVQDPYDDPNDAYINNTMQGKIMLVRVQQQVVDASGSGNDTPVRYSPTNFSPQYPHPVRLLSQVNSRNRFGQVVEEEDNAGLKTRYVFSPADVIEYEDCYQDSIHSMVLLYLNENPGLPSEVIVGYGRSDAQVTRYEYDDRRRVAKLTDPAGTELTYEYDERGRLYRGYRNGSLLQEQAYSQWQNDGSLSFAQRSYQNYVQSTTYIDDTQSTSERSYLDPLGRQRGQVKDGSIVMGNSIYNNAGQLRLQLKPSVGSLPLIDFDNNSGNADVHTETQYENHFRSRPLRMAKNGLSISGSRVVQNSYCSQSAAELASALQAAGLSTPTPAGTQFLRVRTTDEDGKVVEEYQNAMGQKVATITSITLGGTAATVFYYDSQGQIREVVNPAGQSSSYEYNYLGQLYRQTTVDGGLTQYAYDARGQLIAERDAEGETRLYEYDLYGRMIRQARTTAVGTSSAIFDRQGNPWIDGTGMTLWADVLANQSIPEKGWYYDDYNPADYNLTSTETRLYLNNSLSNTRGKLVQSVSYNLAGAPIQFKFLSYNDDGFLKWEIEQFNYNGITAAYPGLTSRIDYPLYNRQGSVVMQNIDLNGDQTLDLQYYYTYDNWNRLKDVYAQFDNSREAGHKVASYEYDDVKGVVSHRRHYASDANCNNIEVDDVQYYYDPARFRLTEINSSLFDWRLYYDGDVGAGNGSIARNYNGNINVTEADYQLGIATNTPGNFLSSTVYSYAYDGLNRLVEADARIEETQQGPLDLMISGDATYSYDKVGNFNQLQRTSFSTSGNSEVRQYVYYYGTGNNRLQALHRGLNGATPSSYRSFQYDTRGNLKVDTKKNINAVTYGKANLPWEIARNNAGLYASISYRYDVNDARIYKESRPSATGVATTSEYYLRSASGQELGIYDFNADELRWYVYGSDRVAQFEHLPTSNWTNGTNGSGGSLGLRGMERQVEELTSGAEKALETEAEEEGSTVWAGARFGERQQVDEGKLENQQKLALAQRLRKADGSFAFPNNLFYIKNRSDESVEWWLQEDWIYFDSTRHELLWQLPLASERQRLVLEDEVGEPLTLSFGELALDGLGPEPDPSPGPQDPFTADLPAMSNAPVPEWSFFVYDHLGNTRVVYTVDLDGACGAVYTLEQVQDYFPYGETLRKFVASGAEERFLTTQHERDRETGFDYRGARFYDGECGRFLSLDPLAMEFPAWSDYNYVLGNPVRFVDPDGRAPDDVILLIWATDDGHIGHAGIAVSNYKLDSDGNYVADGTYSYQDLWPASAVGITNSGEDVRASYGSISSTTLGDLINTDVTGSEGYNPDGVLKISTSYTEDQKVLSDLSNFKNNNPNYNGQTCNCSDFASEGVKSVIESKSSNPFEVINVDQSNIGKEIIQMVGSATTPNQLWKDTKIGLGGAIEVLKDPGKKVDNTFIEGAKGN